ncbi:MAG: transposase [Acidimicrobiia bacterium]
MCELLVGLADVAVTGVDDVAGAPIRVHVESRQDQGWCRDCGVRAGVKDRTRVALVDLPCFGRPVRLVWHKHRWQCRQHECAAGSWTVTDDRIAARRAGLTDRAGRWVTKQVGKLGRSVNEVAKELGCDWHTVNDAVVAYGEALLEADTERVGQVDAVGLDETLFLRQGPRHHKQWCTSVVDVGINDYDATLIEVVEGRTARAVSAWLDEQPQAWKEAIRFGVLDMSGPYRKVFTDSLGHVTQVADPFHVTKVRHEAPCVRGRVRDPPLWAVAAVR